MRRPLVSTLIALLVSGGLIYWLLSATSLETIQDAVQRLPLWRVIVAVALLTLVQWVRAWRFAVLINGTLAMPGASLVRVTLHLLLFNFILPFKLGEASFPVLMRRTFGTDLGSAVGHLLVARAFDAMTILGLMLIAAASLPGHLLPEASAPLLLALGVLVLGTPAALVVLFGHLRGMAPASARIVRRLTEGAANARSARLLVGLLGQSLVIWGMHILVAWLVVQAVAEAIPPAAIAMASAASHMAFALPVPAVAGLGAPQAAFVAGLTLTGVAWPLAVTAALLVHGVILLAVLFLGLAGVVPWQRSITSSKQVADKTPSPRKRRASPTKSRSAVEQRS